MDKCTLTLPYPPSVNHYKTVGAMRVTKSGKFYQPRVNTQATTQFYYDCWVEIRKLNPAKIPKFATDITIKVEVSIWLYPPDNRRFDIDNRLKVLLDGLVHGKLLADDSQIVRLTVQKMGIIPKGKVVVTVTEVGERKDGDVTRTDA